jgi:hypothetical protein
MFVSAHERAFSLPKLGSPIDLARSTNIKLKLGELAIHDDSIADR